MNISRMEFVCEEDGKEVIRYIENILFSSENYKGPKGEKPINLDSKLTNNALFNWTLVHTLSRSGTNKYVSADGI